ncbi:hypothetical protein BDF22DRAFT_661670 [Syncephalis plumigaleata]|nr:hypothetical protein BDF22DRAFT_661670 [Syncephalis plumigaleata]
MYRILVVYSIVLTFIASIVTAIAQQVPPTQCSLPTSHSSSIRSYINSWSGLESAYLHWPFAYQSCFTRHSTCYQLCNTEKACCDQRLLQCIKERYTIQTNDTRGVANTINWQWHITDGGVDPLKLIELPGLQCDAYLQYQASCKASNLSTPYQVCVKKNKGSSSPAIPTTGLDLLQPTTQQGSNGSKSNTNTITTSNGTTRSHTDTAYGSSSYLDDTDDGNDGNDDDMGDGPSVVNEQIVWYKYRL